MLMIDEAPSLHRGPLKHGVTYTAAVFTYTFGRSVCVPRNRISEIRFQSNTSLLTAFDIHMNTITSGR